MDNIFKMISEIPAVTDFHNEQRSAKDRYSKECKDLLDDLIEKENDYYEKTVGWPNIITHDQTGKLDSLGLTTKGVGMPEGLLVIDISTLYYREGPGRAGKLVFTLYDKDGRWVAAASLSHAVVQAYLDGLDL